ncbi:uncharacterized protein LOC131329029 isoform X2 [Rhododendron vialii]|uniref:uncharacterized protein LOC131329029 isoform X2 n=1 Tax=Rhododendron vialii TaxID=182163 RepID=UPI00265F0297|nr:uncharacterized protein LOC131329029 isoform X2 [Rhododendron vialii]
MGIGSHQDAANWRNRSFPHFDMLKIEEATNKFSQALGVDLDIARKRDQINDRLRKLSKISVLQRHKALLAIAHDQAMTACFFTLKDEEKKVFVKTLLMGDLE